MKIYTKTGDGGETSLLSGLRVSKADPRLDAYGTVDELNSVLGVCLAQDTWPAQLESLKEILVKTQHRLFVVGSHLACDAHELTSGLPEIKSSWINELEMAIDRMDSDLPPLRQFILPGGTELAARLHLARTICRRAERGCAQLQGQQNPNLILALKYLNRLSDFLFVAARYSNLRAQQNDVLWSKEI